MFETKNEKLIQHMAKTQKQPEELFKLHLTEKQLDILLLKLFNGKIPTFAEGTFPKDEAWFGKKALIYGKINMMIAAQHELQGQFSDETIIEVINSI